MKKKKKRPPQRPKSNKYKEIKNPERGTRMNLQQQHYLANMNSGSKIIAALTDENPSSAKEVVESTLLRKAGECIKENVGPAIDKSPINEGYHEESYHEGLQAGYLYASHCYNEAMTRREGMHRLNANVMEPGMNERSYTWGTRPAFGGRRRKVRVKDGDTIPPGFIPSKPDGPLGVGRGNHGPFGPSI